jgi:23S rRNA (cytosine1962-C5)-methyltransferase
MVPMNDAPIAVPSLAAARVVLKPRKALPFYGRHPWVLASAVDRVEPTSVADEHLLDIDGQIVELVNEKGRFIARGLYNSRSRIAVRLYTWVEEEPLDEAFFRRKLAGAIELRRQIGYEPTRGADIRVCREGDGKEECLPHRSETATRLVFSEADGISGLVVDRYGDCLVVQPTALGIAQRLEPVVGILQEMLQPRAIVLRLEKATAKLEGMVAGEDDGPLPERDGATIARERTVPRQEANIPFADGHIWGDLPAGPLTIHEHGLAYEVDLRVGQKTGLYLDQRENRLAAAKYFRGKRVLDMFCYTGGFAMTAAALGGATEVLGIDGSKRAIEQAAHNAQINGLQNVRFECGDGFKTLDKLIAQGEQFDAVILDPPKFARGRGGANQALMAYHRLNRAAVELLVGGGILLTCSCTGGVSREDFLLMLSGVAQKSRRDIRVLEQRGAAPDHPIGATCLETEYLKCMICEIR